MTLQPICPRMSEWGFSFTATLDFVDYKANRLMTESTCLLLRLKSILDGDINIHESFPLRLHCCLRDFLLWKKAAIFSVTWLFSNGSPITGEIGTNCRKIEPNFKSA